MATLISTESGNQHNAITEEDIKLILTRNNEENEDHTIEDYYVYNASNKMLGFLAEYLKVKVYLTNRKVLDFFIKAISKTNKAKAEMVKEMKLFDKESLFYSDIIKDMSVPGIKPWSPRLITVLNDAMVFEDLNAMKYKLRDKFERFDIAHTFEALKTLARFHASSIIFEEKRKKETHSLYKITDDHPHLLDKGGYKMSCEWYIQCMNGALEAIKEFSNYNETEMKSIEKNWRDVWSTALDLSDFIPGQKNVICHRDLWNNNIMFHYKIEDEELVPDNCLFVDYQAVKYQPPASDVMVLLCCNLDPKFREGNTEIFLNFYYEELKNVLANNNIQISGVMPMDEFLVSAEEQTKWGLVVCAALIPQFWLDDDLTTNLFCDNVQFDTILNKSKGQFIKTMMTNNYDYRQTVMEIFEEIADRYCFDDQVKE